MAWKKTIAVVIAVGMMVSLLAWLRAYYVKDGANGDVIWNSTDAYVLVQVYQYGYTFSYLGYFAEVARDIFPFGASPPENKHYYAVVLHITPEAVQRYSVNDFDVRNVFAVGKTISAGGLFDQKGPMKWSGTHFESMTQDEVRELREGVQIIPPGPSYDDVAGWSRRRVDLVSSVSDAEVMIKLGGMPVTLRFHSGFPDHDAFIELSRSGLVPERMWSLTEGAHAVSKAAYQRIFEHMPASH